MGCDGGVIATNRKFLRGSTEYKRPGRLHAGEVAEYRNAAEARAIALSQCALSGQKLAPPVVACELGKMFKKEVILEYMLDEELKAVLKENPKFKHIRSMKDLTNVIFTPNPEVSEVSDKAKPMVRGETATTSASDFICPITLLEMNGRYPFFVHRPTGYIISEKAIKEVGGKAVLQTLLGKEEVNFDREDLTLLAPDSTLEFDILKQIKERRKKAKNAKKAKKEATAASLSSSSEKAVEPCAEQPKEKKEKRKRGKDKGMSVKKGKIVDDAIKLLKADKSKNKVLASLFHEKPKEMSRNDMMMTVGGQRYTLS